MCVTSVTKITTAAWLPTIVQKKDIGRGLQTTCDLCKTTTKQGPISGILKHFCGLETCTVIRLTGLLDVFENSCHSDKDFRNDLC